MDELIKQLISQLGMNSNSASQALGSVLSLIKKQGGDEVFSKLSSALPDVSKLADAAPELKSGGLLSSILSMFGGGKTAMLAAALKSAGLKPDQFGSFAKMVVNFIKEKAGQQVLDQILARVPMLKSIIG